MFSFNRSVLEQASLACFYKVENLKTFSKPRAFSQVKSDKTIEILGRKGYHTNET